MAGRSTTISLKGIHMKKFFPLAAAFAAVLFLAACFEDSDKAAAKEASPEVAAATQVAQDETASGTPDAAAGVSIAAPSADEIVETPEGPVSDVAEMDGGEEKPFPAEEPAAVAGVGALTAHEWLLEDIKGGGVIDRLRLTIRIDAAGKVSGHSGCNRFGGQAEMKPGQDTSGEISFGALFSTRMACMDDARNNQEAAYLAALSEVAGWRTDENGLLHLTGANGADVLRFAKAE